MRRDGQLGLNGISFGVLGRFSIEERLLNLKELKIDLTPPEILSLNAKDRPPALSSARKAGCIVVDPPYTKEELDFTNRSGVLGNVSLDLELGDLLKVCCPAVIGRENPENRFVVDLDDPETITEAEERDAFYQLEAGKSYVLEPGAFVRAYTNRYFFMPHDLVGWVTARSKCARFGITSTVDAPKIDPGFAGRIVLEIAHLGQYPIKLKVGMRLCQITFMTVEGQIGTPYDELRTDVLHRQDGISYLVPPTSFQRIGLIDRGMWPFLWEQDEEKL